MNIFWDPSIPGDSTSLGTSQKYSSVIDVITNEEHPDYDNDGFNVGTIRFKYLDFGGHSDTPTNSFYAQPLEITVQEYPLIGEIVMIHKVQGIHYYSRRINVNKTLQLNSLPDIINRLKPSRSVEDRTNATQQARQGILNQTDDTPEENLTNKNYIPNKPIYGLKSFDGDVIFQNRHGASIRFGSSQSEDALNQKSIIDNNTIVLGPTVSGPNTPIIFMRVGQRNNPLRTKQTTYALTVENINVDSSCFVLSEKQQINFNFSGKFKTLDQLGTNIYFPSILNDPDGLNTTILIGNQSILNSGRLIFNSKETDIIFSSNRDFLVTSNRDLVLDTIRNIYLNPISNTGLICLGTDVDDTSIDNYVVKFNELEDILESILTFISTLANQTQYQFPNPTIVTQAKLTLGKIDTVRSRLVKIKK